MEKLVKGPSKSELKVLYSSTKYDMYPPKKAIKDCVLSSVL